MPRPTQDEFDRDDQLRSDRGTEPAFASGTDPQTDDLVLWGDEATGGLDDRAFRAAPEPEWPHENTSETTGPVDRPGDGPVDEPVDDWADDWADEWDDDSGDGGVDDWAEAEDEDFIYVPEERGIVRKIMIVAASFIMFVFLTFGLGGYWLYSQVNPGGGDTEAVLVVIPKDAGLAAISRILEEKEVISNATIFRYYAKWKDIPAIRAGEYDKLYKRTSMDDVIARLKLGPLPARFTDVNIPEGLWVTDTIARIKEKYPEMSNDQAFLQSANTLTSKYFPKDRGLQGLQRFDGFLFPATYRVLDDDKGNSQALLDQMLKKFDQVGDEIGLADPAAKLKGAPGNYAIGPYEVIIVASLIEAEAKVPEDRPKIARVIYNRLRLTPRQPLGIDATVFVALGQHKTELTRSDLDTNSPYNLRKVAGLTPTPINSPGRDSLVAALNPSTDPGSEQWQYYVLEDKEGHHFFTGNYNEFLRAQERARQNGLL